MKRNLIKLIQQDDVFKENKSVTILMSGGIDSACMLEYALEMKYRVHLVYTDIKNNIVKSEREQKAARKIVSYFNGKYHTWTTFYVNEVFLSATEECYPIIFKQMPIHILSSLCSMSNTDEIWIGYVMGDQGLSYTDVLEKIWKSYELLWDITESEKPFPMLKFPIKRVNKRLITEGIDQEVLQFVTFCECDDQELNINNERCGVCDSCKRYDYEFPNKISVSDKFHHFHSVKDYNKEQQSNEIYEKIEMTKKSKKKKSKTKGKNLIKKSKTEK